MRIISGTAPGALRLAGRGQVYEVADLCWTVAELNRQALAWEGVYNTVRPHQALGYKTPKQFLEELPDRSGPPP